MGHFLKIEAAVYHMSHCVWLSHGGSVPPACTTDLGGGRRRRLILTGTHSAPFDDAITAIPPRLLPRTRVIADTHHTMYVVVVGRAQIVRCRPHQPLLISLPPSVLHGSFPGVSCTREGQARETCPQKTTRTLLCRRGRTWCRDYARCLPED